MHNLSFSSHQSLLYSNNEGPAQGWPNHSGATALVPAVDQDQSNDPIRLARDHWVGRDAYINDSSTIIDAIDVEMLDVSEPDYVTEIYLILDTNILIHHLSVVKKTLSRMESDDTRLSHVILLVPGIVVSELDFQKKSAKSIAYESRHASDWLAREIGNGKGRVKGQAYTQTTLPSGDWRQRCGLSNDELILDCCKYFSHIKRKDVLFCTNDNNLAVQALANATDLFIRGISAVIRPPRKLWDADQLLKCALPDYVPSVAASMHASSQASRGHPPRSGARSVPIATSQARGPPPSYPVHDSELDKGMEVDMEDPPAQSGNPRTTLPRRRDDIHQHLTKDIQYHIRMLTGKASRLQQDRRDTESMYSSINVKFTGPLPTENDWARSWSMRDCLKFLVKIPPPRQRTWSFGDAEASSLADFLGLPGERGARPGREWAKHDWGRELLKVSRLAQDLDYAALDQRKLAEYEYAVLEAFAAD
ncbi:PIN domain-containing protein [Hysterangium stoloniferum]|nr:PIN domain-containing protein [Hysterangium stoloniferum]